MDRRRLDMDSDLRDIYDLANKNNVAIYAVDPRGLSTGEFGIDQKASTSRPATSTCARRWKR